MFFLNRKHTPKASTCSNRSMSHLFASVSKYSCSEFNKVSEGSVRSLPMVIIPTGHIEEGLKICKAVFHITDNLLWEAQYLSKIDPLNQENCVSVTFSNYNGSGYQSAAFGRGKNITGVQVKTISFSMSNLNIGDNNVTCSSFKTPAKIGKVSRFLERQMLRNTSLFSRGTFYLIDHGQSVSTIYQNSSTKFNVNLNSNSISLQPMNDICSQGCTEVCYGNYSIKAVPVSHLGVLNITAPEICKVGYGNITAESDGCYLGTGRSDIFNITAKRASIISRKGADVFLLNEQPGADIVIKDFEVGVDRLDLSSLINMTGLDSLNITEGPTTVNLPSGQRIQLPFVNKTMLTGQDFSLHNNISEQNSIPDPHTKTPTSEHNTLNSNYSYLWLLAVPCAITVVGISAAFLIRHFMHRDKSLDPITEAGMSLQAAIEVHNSMITERTPGTHSPISRLAHISMPPPLYTHTHSPIAHSPYMLARSQEPYYSPPSSPARQHSSAPGLSIEFPEPSSPTHLQLDPIPPVTLPSLINLPGSSAVDEIA